MSDNPYQSPGADLTEAPLPAPLELAKLKGIAETQRWVNRWALVEIGALVAVNTVPKTIHPDWRFVEIVLGGGLAVFLTLALFVGNIQLAYRTKGIGSAVLIGFISWLPWANLVGALIATLWARRMLKDAGFTVGLWGGRPGEIQQAIDAEALG